VEMRNTGFKFFLAKQPTTTTTQQQTTNKQTPTNQPFVNNLFMEYF